MLGAARSLREGGLGGLGTRGLPQACHGHEVTGGRGRGGAGTPPPPDARSMTSYPGVSSGSREGARLF